MRFVAALVAAILVGGTAALLPRSLYTPANGEIDNASVHRVNEDDALNFNAAAEAEGQGQPYLFSPSRQFEPRLVRSELGDYHDRSDDFTLTLAPLAAAGSVRGAERAGEPNDPYWINQWNLATNPGVGIDLLEAWRWGRGEGAVIAVVDTGIVPQSEFRGRILPGYDFVSNVLVANDGDGRDADPRDPGDWVTETEAESGKFFEGCDADESSWHGTHVAGIALAAANNERGITGIAPRAKLLPVRALGKCGGTERDLVDALRWAGGLQPLDAPRNRNVPRNRNPASIINLSLGGLGQCGSALQNAIDELSAREILVVVAAGNDAISAEGFTPANCENTLTVAATDNAGQRAPYSNYGAYVQLSAPGGTSGAGVLSTIDRGRKRPKGAALGRAAGTSMAAPHVAGTLAIARGLDRSISSLELLSLLRDHLAPFTPNSVEYGCDTPEFCGAGFLDAGAFITALQSRPTAIIEATVLEQVQVDESVEFSIAVDGEAVLPELFTPTVCAVEGTTVIGLARGICKMEVNLPSTAQRKGVSQQFLIRVTGFDPSLSVLAPGGMRIGDKVPLSATVDSGGTLTYKSRTPRVCKVGSAGRVTALSRGTCRVRINVSANGDYEEGKLVVSTTVTR
jgi:serine protease